MSSTTSATASLRARAGLVSSPSCSSLVSVSPNCTSMLIMKTKIPLSALSIGVRRTPAAPRSRSVSCEVAVEVWSSSSQSQSTSSQGEGEGEGEGEAKIGARVRVKVPLKVYHVPKVPEVDLTGMEGQIKQYVGLWNGKRISANLPYKVQFVADIQGRGHVKFFAHLKEEEFDYV